MKRERKKEMANVAKKFCHAVMLLGAAVVTSLLWAFIMFPQVVVYTNPLYEAEKVVTAGALGLLVLVASPVFEIMREELRERREKEKEWEDYISEVSPDEFYSLMRKGAGI